MAHRSRALVSHSSVLGSIPTKDDPDIDHIIDPQTARCERLPRRGTRCRQCRLHLKYSLSLSLTYRLIYIINTFYYYNEK